MQTLILSCNTGAGHNSCAQAVQEAYHSRGEICNITDSLQFISEKASTFISNWHTRIYRHAPRLFDAGYQRAESHEDIFCEGTPIYKLLSSGAERMYQYIRSAGYDNIICTHVFPALALTEMRRQHPCLQLVTSHISTDYTCAPCTADSALDWYFIPSTSLLGEFEQCGLQPQKLIASGIPVRQQFYQRVSQEAGKANAGISPAHQHILMMCGSMGCGPMEEIISYLCPYLTTEQELSVVCGTNDDLRKKLQKRTEKYSQVHVLGTVNNVPQLMQASDLFLTKPGGLSTSEAMAAELPMVLIDAVAGCETHNLNFFLRNGMAVTANTPKAIADTTIKTLNAPVLLSKMRAAMRSQTECTAADKIYEWIYSHASNHIKPEVNYREFRIHKLNTPEFSHVRLLLYWPIFGLLFLFLERLQPQRNYYPVYCGLDDIIPFCEWALIPYLFWFVFLIGTLVYTFFVDVPAFRRMMYFVIVTYTITVLIYLFFPTCQNLRPEAFVRNNLLTRFIELFYSFDTNTNVCPSLHVIGSVAAMFGLWDCKALQSVGWKIAATSIAVCISLSTVFMKQHSIMDVLAALPVCFFGWWIAYKILPNNKTNRFLTRM